MGHRAPRSRAAARRRAALTASLLAVSCVGASAVSARADEVGATAAGFADTTAGIHLWAPLFMTGGRLDSEEEAAAAARRFDVIAGLPHQFGGHLDAMRAANPRLRVYVYVNASYLHDPQLPDLPSWVLAHTPDGDLTGAVVSSITLAPHTGEILTLP